MTSMQLRQAAARQHNPIYAETRFGQTVMIFDGIDRDRLARYHELFRELGGYPYDRDPGRPGWYPLIPNARWADPGVAMVPKLR